MESLFITWHPDPQIFGLPPRWYGLLFASAFFFGYIIVNRFFKKEGIPEAYLETMTVYMAIGTILGARLGHCLFYEPEYYLANPLEMLYIWKGGLASHGAAIGITLALWIFSRRVSKRSILWALDRIVIPVALSGLFIRTGNLMNSEIVGSDTTAPWGFVFQMNDQDFGQFEADWEGDVVLLDYNPDSVKFRGEMEVWRHYTDSQLTYLGDLGPNSPKEAEYWRFTDTKNPVKDQGRIKYQLYVKRQMFSYSAAGIDSNDTRKAIFEQSFGPDSMLISGRWTAGGLEISYKPGGNVPGNYLQLLRSTDRESWYPVKVGQEAIDSLVPNTAYSFVDPNASDGVFYRLRTMRDRIKSVELYARHPSQIYEAFAYLLIFFLLMFLYYRQNAKVPHGQLFGIFLVLTFTARFIIEFFKEVQVDFEKGMTLNMGQWLSIPLIVIGFFFIGYSMKRGYREDPPFAGGKIPGKDKKGKSNKPTGQDNQKRDQGSARPSGGENKGNRASRRRGGKK